MTRNSPERTEMILRWRASIAQLNDNHFFELMRMYLGEIQTPFNKQKLIEALGNFLHKEEVRQNVALLISPGDIRILTAVQFMDNPTTESLTGLFSGSITCAELHETLMNLEERLLLFQYQPDSSGHPVYAINPLLQDIILPRLSVAVLLPPAAGSRDVADTAPVLTPQLLAAFFAFTAARRDLYKQDGELKKKIYETILNIFPCNSASPQDREHHRLFFTTLGTALINLNLLKPEKNGWIPDYERWLQFSRMAQETQYAYLAAAASGRSSRMQQQQKVRHIQQLLSMIPPDGFPIQTLERAEYLLLHLKGEPDTVSRSRTNKTGRFARIMAAAQMSRTKKSDDTTATGSGECEYEERKHLLPADMDSRNTGTCPLYEAAIRLGLIRQNRSTAGSGQKPEPVYTAYIPGNNEYEGATCTGFISLDAGFTVTLFPGLPLVNILPVIRFLDIRQFDTTVRLEITRDSVLRSFDQDLTPDDISNILQEYITYPLPQNISITLEDWYHHYTAATIYRGYLLHIKDGRDPARNPLLAPYILRQLESGLYLMNFADDQEAETVLKSSSFFTGTVRTCRKPESLPVFFPPGKTEVPPLPPAYLSPEPAEKQEHTITGTPEAQQLFLNKMLDDLNHLNLEPYQTEGLETRINRRIILIPEQLRGTSVKQEILEAGGMDFVGKVHIAEHAVETGTRIELCFENKQHGQTIITGIPVAIEKTAGDALIYIENTTGSPTGYSLMQASNVRRYKGAIFRE